MPQTLKDENEAIRKKMKEPAYHQKAEDVLNWFKGLPAQEISSNTYYQNVKIMIDEDAVETKMINYIIGLYAAWKRANPQAAGTQTPAGNRLVKEWPQAWGAGPHPANKEHAVVKFVKRLPGSYNMLGSQVVFMMLDNGQGVTWMYSGKNEIEKDDEFDLTGEFKPDTYHTPPTVRFYPDRKWLRNDAFKP